jgi:prepilin-type N-terminal cleavage/methylation domain-containing protein
MNKRAGFTLLELLVSVVILTVLVTLLFSILSQASRLFSRGEAQTDALGNFRAATAMIRRDLRSALLPVDRTNQAGLQFILNPDTVSAAYKNRDALFWQCATSGAGTNSRGVSVVGYYVKWDASDPGRPQARLCRVFIDSADPNFLVYQNPGSWITDAILEAAAPASPAQNYRGLLAENVIGLWITVEENTAGVLTPAASFDSRGTGVLPAAVRVSLAFLSPSAAKRLTPAEAAAIRARCLDGATGFLDGLPETVRSEARLYTTRVVLP